MLPSEVTAAASIADASVEESTEALGREDFLRMLIAQLENQDPLNPQDATEFTAQLAQFSSLEQLLEMRESLSAVADSQRSLASAVESSASAGLIGHEAVVRDDRFEVGAGGSLLSRPALELDGRASSVTLRIADASGASVASLDVGPLGSGFQELPVARLEALGLSPGVYRISTEASSAGEAISSRSLVTGTVTGAMPTSTGSLLRIGAIAIPYAELSEVRGAGAGS